MAFLFSMREYFSHDLNARNDRKLVNLVMKHGMGGIGVFWCIVEMLFEEEGSIMLSECERIAFELRTTESLVLSVINDFGLFKNDGLCFFSESVNRRIESQISVSNGAKKAANARWQKFKDQKNIIPDANALPTQAKRNARKEKESKKKESKENLNPEVFYGEFHSLILEWFQYKKERKESYKSDNSKLAFQKKLEELSGQNFEKAKAIIQQSMANNWAGIFELKNNIQQVQSGSDALREELNKRNNFRKSQAQQNLEDFQSMRAAIQFDLEHPPLTEIGDGTNA